MKRYIWWALLFGLVVVGVVISLQNDRPHGPVIVWSLENEYDRIQGLKADLEIFTKRTGIETQVVPVSEDQLSSAVVHTVATGSRPDVIAGISARFTLNYAREGFLNAEAAQSVIDHLDEKTFLPSGLQRVRLQSKGFVAVPSDGWGQLLYYRKDMFRKAGLQPPRTMEDVIQAAKILDRPDEFRHGIALASAGDELFTEQSFESVALAYGCQLIDHHGKITIGSPACRQAFRSYITLVNLSFGSGQGVDATRDTYFVGQSAMLFWSPFLLDAMAGLQGGLIPDCPQCQNDINFLAANTGVISDLGSSNVPPTHYGSVVAFGIVKGNNEDASKRVVEYLMSDGYTRWLAVNPAGKYPMRRGTQQNPLGYQRAWRDLLVYGTGDTKPPIGNFYSSEVISTIISGTRTFTAWGVPQGQGPLAGSLAVSLPVPLAIDDLLNGLSLDETLKELMRQIKRQQDQG